jgi:hypothetical protein
MHTPGHAPGHLVYCERRTGLVYAGDMVAGVGTILIDPEDDGDMIAYLASLERIAAAGPRRTGARARAGADDPQGLLRRYRAHRLMREDRVLAAIQDVPRDLSAVLADAYADTPEALWPLAARSLEAHLRKLVAEGRVRRLGASRWPGLRFGSAGAGPRARRADEGRRPMRGDGGGSLARIAGFAAMFLAQKTRSMGARPPVCERPPALPRQASQQPCPRS